MRWPVSKFGVGGSLPSPIERILAKLSQLSRHSDSSEVWKSEVHLPELLYEFVHTPG